MKIVRIQSYLVGIEENTDQNNSEHDTFYVV